MTEIGKYRVNINKSKTVCYLLGVVVVVVAIVKIK